MKSPLKNETRWAWLFNCTSAILMLALPMMVFLKHQGYPLVRLEILALFGGLLVTGLVTGLAMSMGRSLGVVAGNTALLILVLDIQTEWFVQLPWLVPVLVILFAVLGWLIRMYLSRLLTLAFGVMFLSTMVLPSGRPVVRVGDFPEPSPAAKDLPLLLHLALDEQIGIEGIPREFDPQGEIAGRMRDFFLDNDFQVYGRAYSRYYDSYESFSNLLNLSASDTVAAYFGGEFKRGALLSENRWFDHLQQLGYGINVIQSDYMRFFRRDDSGKAPSVGRCLAYTTEAIQAVDRAPFSTVEKIPFILGTYVRLSSYLKTIYARYRIICLSSIGSRLHLPDLGRLDRTRVSPLSSWEVVSELKDWLTSVQPGQAIFAHILLPHYPYAFDENCQLETQAALWLEAADPDALPHRNDSVSRALRYPPYLEQVLCVRQLMGEMFEILQDRGLWENSIIIVHGDHGSRIDRGPPEPPTVDQMVDSDFQDAYSTLFAVKVPGSAGGYRREQLPIDHLLESLLVDGVPPGNAELENNPFVFIRSAGKTMPQHPIALFDHGVAP